MAYDEHLADRIRLGFAELHVKAAEKKMMGGLCFMVNDKMCAGVVGETLVVRIDPALYEQALTRPGAREMEFTGRPMKGFVFVEPEGIDDDADLQYWLQLCHSGAAGTVGRYAVSCIADVEPRVDFIRRCLSLDGDLRSKAEWCLQGFLWAIGDDSRAGVLQAVAEELPAEDLKRLFICAPFQASTWCLLDSYDVGTGRTFRPGSGTPPPS